MNNNLLNISLKQGKQFNSYQQNISTRRKEGFVSLEQNKSGPDLNDLNGMLSDSDLLVLNENYTYILWSILAIGVLTITINTMKK